MRIKDFREARDLLSNMEHHERQLKAVREGKVLVLRLENHNNHKTDIEEGRIKDSVRIFLQGWLENEILSLRDKIKDRGVVL